MNDPIFQLASAMLAGLFLAILATRPCVWVLNQVYRRKVLRLMMAEAGATPAEEVPAAVREPPPPGPRFEQVGDPRGGDGWHREPRNALLKAYAAAGLAYAVSMGALFAAAGGTGFGGWVVCAWAFAMPLAWTLPRMAGARGWVTAFVFVAFLVAGWAAAVLEPSQRPIGEGGPGEILTWFALFAVALRATWGRAVGSIAPLVYGAMLVVFAVLFAVLTVAAVHPALAVPALAAAAVGLAWGGRRLAAMYVAKRLSDEMVLLSACWLVITLWAFTLGAGAGYRDSREAVARWLPLLALLPLVLFHVVLRVALRRNAARRPARPPLKLLFLRTFGARGRSERLMEQVAVRWRYAGSINLIAGGDLASMSLEPHELVDFVRGRLASHFAKNETEARRAVEALDHAPDPNGRFRVNELFCHADTWKGALHGALAEVARGDGVVLLDFRGFLPRNAGCVYEMGHLVHHVPLSRAVFVLDGTSDVEAFEAGMRRAWAVMAADSPNRRQENATVRVFHLPRAKPSAVASLVDLLHRTASAPALPAAAPADAASALAVAG